MKLLQIIESSWARLTNLGVNSSQRLGTVRSIQLLNQLSVLLAFISSTFIFFDNEIQPLNLRVLEIICPFVFISIPLINHAGFPLLSRYVIYAWANFFCLMMALVMGLRSGTLLYFIPIVAATTLVFNLRRGIQAAFVLAFPLLATGLIFQLGDTYAIDWVMHNDAFEHIFLRNFMITLALSFLMAALYFHITYRQQNELRKSLDGKARLNGLLQERESVLKKNLEYTNDLLDELGRREAYFSALTSQASDIIAVVDAQGDLQYVSDSFYRLLGYTEKEVLRKNVFDFIHPQDASEAMNLFRNRVGNGPEIDAYQLRYRKADGGFLYLEAKGKNLLETPGVEGIVINARNITERVRYERELKRREANTRSILDHNDISIWMVGENYRLVEFNKVFADEFLLAYGIQLEPEMDMMAQVPPAEQAKWVRRYDRAFSGESQVHYDTYYYEGEERVIRLNLFPVFNEFGQVDRCTVFGRDITEQILNEQAIIEARDKAEEASHAKAQFLSTMSHEMRTPMNAIIGMAHLLLDEQPRTDQAENLRILKFSAENLLALINDVLDFNKIEAGKIEFEQTPFNLSRFILDLKKSFLPVAQEKGVRLEVLHDADLPEQVLGDPLRLGQVLTNLIGNAIKFTDEGEVTVEVTLHQENTDTLEIEFSVRDTGIGIPIEKQGIIFESFTQASSETTRRYGGTGLGLAITKRLLELQDSHIRLESQPGEGAHFWFRLRFGCMSEALQRQSLQEPRLKQQTNSLEGREVLLVEDNPLNVHVASKFLNKWGVRLRVAENAAQALQLMQAQPCEIILLDLQLPDMDGFELMGELKQFPHLPPVLALSAAAETTYRDRALAVGMKGYILKPFEPDTLYRAMVKALQAAELQTT